MRNPLRSICVMLSMLVLGAGLGRFTAAGNRSKTIRAQTAQSPEIPSPADLDTPVRSSAGHGDSARPSAENYLGVTFAGQVADVVARSEGSLDAVYVNVGDRLKPGEAIANIASSSAASELAIAEASLRSAQAEESNAKAELKDAQSRTGRREKLAEAGLLSREDLETAQVQLAKAQANLYASEARVTEQLARITQAKQSLADAIVRASFSGEVSARYLDAGAAVRSGVPIVRIIRADDLWVRFAIPEKERASIRPGATVRFCPQGTSDSLPAIIEHISPEVTATSQEIVVEAKLKIASGCGRQIRPGDVGLVAPVSLPHKPLTGHA